MRKTYFYITFGTMLILLAGALAYSQEGQTDRATVPFSNPDQPGLLEVTTHNGSITVKGYEGREVIVEAQVKGTILSKRKKENEKASGMRLIQTLTTGLEVEEENNVMEVSVQSFKNQVDLMIQVPYSTSLKLSGHNKGQITVENVNGEIEANHHNGPLILTDISGSVVAHTFNGAVQVTFVTIDPEKPMSFSTWNGDIDVTFPQDLKANVKMKSDRGDIYSDFEVSIEQAPQKAQEDPEEKSGKYQISFGKFIYGKIGGGGPEFVFNNYNGDILIRKK